MKELKNFTIIIPCIIFKDVEKSITNIRKIYKKTKIIICLNQKIHNTKDKNLKFIFTKVGLLGAFTGEAVLWKINSGAEFLGFSKPFPSVEV